MDASTATLIIGLIRLLIEKGVPVYMEWADGMELKDPTLEDIQALHGLVPMPDKP